MFDVTSFIKTAGYIGVAGIVFAESGLLVGFFLPGDSLLFTAGFLASQGYINIHLLAVLVFIAAVAGDSVGYSLGRQIGPKIFNREKSLFFNKRHADRAHNFYVKHGGKAVTLARFLPVVRTFAPTIAGVGHMKYRKFLAYNILGAAIWAVGLPYIGYWAGASIPGIETYIGRIVLAILVLSFLPGVIHVLRDKNDRALLIAGIKKVFSNKV